MLRCKEFLIKLPYLDNFKSNVTDDVRFMTSLHLNGINRKCFCFDFHLCCVFCLCGFKKGE